MELPGGDDEWLAPSPSPPGPAVPDRHDEHGVGTFIWPPVGTSTWPPVGTFSWPRTHGRRAVGSGPPVSGTALRRIDETQRRDGAAASTTGEFRPAPSRVSGACRSATTDIAWLRAAIIWGRLHRPDRCSRLSAFAPATRSSRSDHSWRLPSATYAVLAGTGLLQMGGRGMKK